MGRNGMVYSRLETIWRITSLQTGAAFIRNPQFYFKEGVTYSLMARGALRKQEPFIQMVLSTQQVSPCFRLPLVPLS